MYCTNWLNRIFRTSGLVLCLCSISCFTACKWFNSQKDRNNTVLAKVGDKYLYTEDVEGIIQPGTNPKDSLMKLQMYVDNWVKLQLMVQKAELNLTREQKDFEREMENLKTTLLIHTYQEQVIEQLLDTNVSESDIQQYYQSHKEQFILRKNLVKCSYVIFSRTIKEEQKVKSWFNSAKEADAVKLLKFCNENAITYQLNDTSWQFMDELERIIPFQYSSQEAFLTRTRFYETRDSSMVYMVKINDYKSKESISPIEFERPIIKSLILNIRKQQILRKMEEDIYNEAVQNKSFETYLK